MTRHYFGTDGIRGQANRFPMNAETALRVGMAAGSYFLRGSHRHRVVIGKDTRLSGYMLESALVSGFTSVGMDVYLVGPMPTPAVAMLTRSLRADLGVMISASHNVYSDNGIKLFGPYGYKLSDAVEYALEERLQHSMESFLVSPDHMGRAKRLEDETGRYVEFVKNTFPKPYTLDGLKIVIDCAHGAAYKAAPKILHELGADIVAIGIEPNGCNINKECGAIYPSFLKEAVLHHKAHIGIALDGDADRLIICDEKGNIIQGDQILAAIATYFSKKNTLKNKGIVITEMSNMGLDHYLKSQDIHVKRTHVGDRYVMETMQKEGYSLGGENSGHIIIDDYTTTGDGMVAALQVFAYMIQEEKPASELFNLFTPFPQLLKNIPFTRGIDPLLSPIIIQAIQEAKHVLQQKGRISVRKSGTEPLIRIMVEGEDEHMIHLIADRLADQITLLS